MSISTSGVAISVGGVPVPWVESTKEGVQGQPTPETSYRDEEGNINLYSEDGSDAEEWSEIDLRNFSSGIELIRTCLKVIWADKEILLYQTISVAICVTTLYFFLFAWFPSFDPETVEE